MTWFCQGWSQKLAEDSAGIWGVVSALVGDNFWIFLEELHDFFFWRYKFPTFKVQHLTQLVSLCRQPKARLFGMVLWVWKPGIFQPTTGLLSLGVFLHRFNQFYSIFQLLTEVSMMAMPSMRPSRALRPWGPFLKLLCFQGAGVLWLVCFKKYVWILCQDPCPWTGPRSQRIVTRQIGNFITRKRTIFQPQASPASSYGALMSAAEDVIVWWCGLMWNLAVYMKLMKPLWIWPAWVHVKVLKNLLLG